MIRIPVEVDELTADWLTEVLQSRYPGAAVTAVTVADRSTGTTGRARLRVESADPRVPESVFVKLAPFSADRRAFVDQQGMGVAEARFYLEVAAEVPVRVPDVLHASHDADGRYIMVFEDLLATGAHYPTQHDAALVSVVDSVIDNFAALHAAFHASERFLADGDLSWIEQRSRSYGNAPAFVQHAVDQLGDQMPAVFHDFAALYVPNSDAIAARLASGPRTLVHGDAHLGNMFVEPDGVGFLDWAVTGYAPGMRDFAYFIGNSVSTEFRREHERRLIDRYCSALGRRDIELSSEHAWDQYRLQMITGWIAAVVTAGFGDALQPLEIGLRATERANIALADLDVVDLIAAGL